MKKTRLELDNLKILVDNLDNRGTRKAVGKNENSSETGQPVKPEIIGGQRRQPGTKKGSG